MNGSYSSRFNNSESTSKHGLEEMKQSINQSIRRIVLWVLSSARQSTRGEECIGI